MTESKGLGSKILSIDRRILTLIGVVLILIPLVSPIGLPLPMNKYTVDVYEQIDSFPEDSVVLIDCQTGLGYWGAMGPPFQAVLKHMLSKGFKIIGWSGGEEGPLMWWKVWESLPENLVNQYEYGVDWCYLGFITGEESAMMKAGEDLKSLVKEDYQGIPIDELPILENVNSVEDYDIVLYLTGSEAYRGMMYRIWGETFDANLILIAQRAVIPVNMIDAGLIKGYIRGLNGAAEYEILSGTPGAATSQLDALSVFFLYMMFLVVLGNIGFLMQKKEFEVK